MTVCKKCEISDSTKPALQVTISRSCSGQAAQKSEAPAVWEEIDNLSLDALSLSPL